MFLMNSIKILVLGWFFKCKVNLYGKFYMLLFGLKCFVRLLLKYSLFVVGIFKLMNYVSFYIVYILFLIF